MEDIKVTSTIDQKTFFNISLLTYFRVRTVIIIIVAFALLQISVLTRPYFDLTEELIIIGLTFGIYFVIFPVTIYFKAKSVAVKTAYLRESKVYTINVDTIAYKGDTISASSSWNDINRLIEREKYFLLRVAVRGVHYLPKDGFESAEEIHRFKNMVREKGLKISYR